MLLDATTLPDVFLPYQQRFMQACETCPVVVEEKSRRTGFSWAAGGVAALKAARTRAAGGSDVLYLGYNLEMAREFIDYVAEWARAIEPAAAAVHEFLFSDPDHPEREIKAFRVEFASGFKVLALPSVARALRGMQGMVILDEAAFHDDLAEMLKSAFALLIWGGQVVVISTHNGDLNPFNVLVQDIRAGRRPYYLGRTSFDDALADGLYRRICLTAGKIWSVDAEATWRAEIIGFYGDGADEELFVIPSPSTGAFLPGPLIEARAEADIPVLRWECPPGFELWPKHLREAEARDWLAAHVDPVLVTLDPTARHVGGNDIARRGDLWVLWVLAVQQSMVRRTPFTVELRNCPFEQQRQILWHILARLPRFGGAWMDATGMGMQIAEETMQKFGASIVSVMMSEPWYRQHMPPLKGAFEDALIVVPRDRDTIDDFRMLKLVRGVARVPERRLNDAGQKRHGDAAIAACLAYAASRADPEIYGYEGASRFDEKRDRYSARPDHRADDRQHGSLLPALRGGMFG
jgi:phage FluMu gp28-like protein